MNISDKILKRQNIVIPKHTSYFKGSKNELMQKYINNTFIRTYKLYADMTRFIVIYKF